MPSYSGIFTLQTQMQAKATSNWPDPNVPSVIGQAFGGGFYAGQIGVSSVATHYLIVGPISSAQSTLQWKNARTGTTGADSVIDGVQNTADMVADGNATVYPAAHFCNNLSTGGQTDWYMPARNEVEICYYNLKPTTQLNNTGWGTNANAVPARAINYTSGTPAQTSATDFKDTGAEDFVNTNYWTSTEYATSTNAAWGKGFGIGGESYLYKDTAYRTRAIRRIPV